MPNSRIFLVGAMGAGKTSVGKKLALHLNLDFIDSDQILQQQQQKSIMQIVHNFGVLYFRKLEELLLAELTAMPNIVLATGGGSILSAQTRKFIRIRGQTCYLKVSPEQQLQRLKSDAARPTLPEHEQRLTFFQHMLAERGCLYEEIADIILDTDYMAIDQLAIKIAESVLIRNV